jgi:hypothetical protein
MPRDYRKPAHDPRTKRIPHHQVCRWRSVACVRVRAQAARASGNLFTREHGSQETIAEPQAPPCA